MSITAIEYQQWVTHNWNRLGYEREPNPLRELFIMSVGLGGETGEVQELLKKSVRDGREIRDDLRLELGDVLHYLTRIASQFGMTLPEIMQANQAKIEARHAKRMRNPMRVALLTESADYDTSGSWGSASAWWPSMADPEGNIRAFVIKTKVVPYGGYVTVDSRLRVHPDYVETLLSSLNETLKAEVEANG